MKDPEKPGLKGGKRMLETKRLETQAYNQIFDMVLGVSEVIKK